MPRPRYMVDTIGDLFGGLPPMPPIDPSWLGGQAPSWTPPPGVLPPPPPPPDLSATMNQTGEAYKSAIRNWQIIAAIGFGLAIVEWWRHR